VISERAGVKPPVPLGDCHPRSAATYAFTGALP
jgi:hypothetical protein